METTSDTICLYLGIKVNTGPLERHRLENFSLESTIESLKQEASARAKMDTDTLELIHHGRILADCTATLAGSGIREGEMIHVLKKETSATSDEAPTYTVTDLQQIVTSLRGFGCTPNAPGWTKAMQVLDDDERLGELLEAVPGLLDDCSSLSILHEIELLAALGATISTMKRGAAALPPLPAALRHLTKMVRAHPPPASSYTAPTSGFAYSLEALSEDEDGDEEDEEGMSRPTPVITQQQLAAALGMARGGLSSQDLGSNSSLEQALRRLTDEASSSGVNTDRSPTSSASSARGSARNVFTEDMINSAVSEALSRADRTSTSTTAAAATDSPMEQGTSASSSQGSAPSNPDDYSTRLQDMHEMGLLDDAVNLHALLVCNGDVNAAINFVFNSMEE